MSDKDHLWQIAVCETGGLFKRPIEFATGGRKTHSYLVTDTSTLSMEPGGLVRRPFDYWGGNPVYSQYDLTREQRARILGFIGAHRNARYDWIGDILVGFDDLTPAQLDTLFHLIEHIEDKLSWAWFCSAFTDAAFTYAGVKVIDDGRPFHAVTPMDLYRQFIKDGSPDA